MKQSNVPKWLKKQNGSRDPEVFGHFPKCSQKLSALLQNNSSEFMSKLEDYLIKTEGAVAF